MSKRKEQKTWVDGGEYVYGDDHFREGLYALEDKCIVFDERMGKFIPKEDMLKVMKAYEKYLKKYLISKKELEDVLDEGIAFYSGAAVLKVGKHALKTVKKKLIKNHK